MEMANFGLVLGTALSYAHNENVNGYQKENISEQIQNNKHARQKHNEPITQGTV